MKTSRSRLAELTVDGEIIDCRHRADWVADSTLVAAVVGALNRLYVDCSVVHGEAHSATGLQRPAVLRPLSGADGARSIAGKIGGAFVFDQGGCGAADGGSIYQRCHKIDRKKN